jgi:MFS family permease
LIAVAFMGSTLITPLYVLYRREFHFSEIMLTLIYATYVVGNLGALLFFGRISDQAGRRRVSLPALALAGAGCVLFLFAGGTVWLFVARLLSGLAVGVSSGTGTAWLAELYGPEQRTKATLMATYANLSGAALGPVASGVLAQYAPRPLQLSFVVYLFMLVVTAIVAAATRETVQNPVDKVTDLQVEPRVGVPKEIRGQFIAPAVTVFGSFALGGFYFALLPSILTQALGQRNLAIAGAIVFELSAVALAAVIATRRLKSERAMSFGLGLLVPGVALLVLAQSLRSMTVLLAGTGIAGVAVGMGYRGSLQVVNEIAPEDRRAEVVSAYFIACFIGNSVPVIGVGVLASVTNSLVASITFACTIAAFAIGTLLRFRTTTR